jgi:NitT/TauT family transport system permease protein
MTGAPIDPRQVARWRVRFAQFAFLAVFLFAWEWASRSRFIDPLFIGRPSVIGRHLWNGVFVDHVIVKEALWTLAGTLTAFALGSIAGIAFGLLFAMRPMAEKFFDPLFAGLNALPRVALAPLFLLWFGLGIGSKIALGFSLTFFIVLNNTVAGARSVDPDWLVLCRTLGASPGRIFFKVTLISAIPTIFSGLKLGLIYALLGVIAGEIIASQHGLGQLLTYLAGTFDTDGVFAVLIFLGVLGVLMIKAMDVLEGRLLRWR